MKISVAINKLKDLNNLGLVDPEPIRMAIEALTMQKQLEWLIGDTGKCDLYLSKDVGTDDDGYFLSQEYPDACQCDSYPFGDDDPHATLLETISGAYKQFKYRFCTYMLKSQLDKLNLKDYPDFKENVFDLYSDPNHYASWVDGPNKYYCVNKCWVKKYASNTDFKAIEKEWIAGCEDRRKKK